MDHFTGKGFSKSGSIGKVFGYASPKLSPDTESELAVLDFETSGLNSKQSRVIEVAVVSMNSQGEITEEYSTLVNPGDGNVGMTMIHHISPRMVESAPSFGEIAEDLKSRLQGRVVVAHNATFEEDFLEQEFKRVGVKLPKFRALDTLQFFPRHLPNLPNYQQGTVLSELGIETDEHTALGDTRGLAYALRNFLKEASALGYPIESGAITERTAITRVSQRVTNLKKGEEGWMRNLIPKLPISSFAMEDFDRLKYWEILTEILADGKITGDEIKTLARFIGGSGLSQKDVQRLNREFVRNQEEAALEDGIVSKAESEHLQKISRALGEELSL